MSAAAKYEAAIEVALLCACVEVLGMVHHSAMGDVSISDIKSVAGNGIGNIRIGVADE